METLCNTLIHLLACHNNARPWSGWRFKRIWRNSIRFRPNDGCEWLLTLGLHLPVARMQGSYLIAKSCAVIGTYANRFMAVQTCQCPRMGRLHDFL